MKPSTMAAGDLALLVLGDNRTFLIRLAPGRSLSTHRGSVAHDRLIGREYGTTVPTSTGEPIHAVRPVWTDLMMKVERRTNIMYPKDVAYVLAQLGVGAGDRVVELGAGSGAMTLALAHAVRPGGRIYAYDVRPEFLELAAENCRRAGAQEGLEFRLRKPGEPLEPGVDAVFCDIPEPWAEVAAAWQALAGSGRFAAATPTYNQAERLAASLAAGGFAMVQTVEVLVRQVLARPGRTRPAHRMIAHTQLLTSGVKVSAPAGSEVGPAGPDPEAQPGRRGPRRGG